MGVEERRASRAVANEQEPARGTIPDHEGERPRQSSSDALAVSGVRGHDCFGIGRRPRRQGVTVGECPVENDLDPLVVRTLDIACLDLEDPFA